MFSLFLRNTFYTILQPGIVCGLIPYYILLKTKTSFPETWQLKQILAGFIFIFGLFVLLRCIIQFAMEGKGTLSPVDPTQRLVIKGFYKVSRNPMYLGVLCILLGEALFFQSAFLLMYSIVVFTVFNVFIIYFEEPRLLKDFKEEYTRYCQQVNRWM